MAEQVSRWACRSVSCLIGADPSPPSRRPDLLVRAARHYEGAGQVLLRQAVMSSQTFITIGRGVMPPIGEWQEVECPARLDLAGTEPGSCSVIGPGASA